MFNDDFGEHVYTCVHIYMGLNFNSYMKIKGIFCRKNSLWYRPKNSEKFSKARA